MPIPSLEKFLSTPSVRLATAIRLVTAAGVEDKGSMERTWRQRKRVRSKVQYAVNKGELLCPGPQGKKLDDLSVEPAAVLGWAARKWPSLRQRLGIPARATLNSQTENAVGRLSAVSIPLDRKVLEQEFLECVMRRAQLEEENRALRNRITELEPDALKYRQERDARRKRGKDSAAIRSPPIHRVVKRR